MRPDVCACEAAMKDICVRMHVRASHGWRGTCGSWAFPEQGGRPATDRGFAEPLSPLSSGLAAGLSWINQ
jgi:hypothetical protein